MRLVRPLATVGCRYEVGLEVWGLGSNGFESIVWLATYLANYRAYRLWIHPLNPPLPVPPFPVLRGKDLAFVL